MRRLGLLIGLLHFTFFILGQSVSEEYQKSFTYHLKTLQLDSLQQVVKEWRSEHPNDPEGFVAVFNYYLLKASQADLQDNQDNLTINGSIGEHKVYVDSALNILDQALTIFPKRLDMHMGYIYTLGQNEYWDKYTTRILDLLENAKLSDYEGWLWSGDRLVGNDTKRFIIESIFDYQYTLFNAYSDSLLLDMQKIALAILSVHPNNIDQLNLMAVSYLEMNEYEQAYKWIRKAIEVDPNVEEIQQNFKTILLKKFKTKAAKKEIRRMLLHASDSLRLYLIDLYTVV